MLKCGVVAVGYWAPQTHSLEVGSHFGLCGPHVRLHAVKGVLGFKRMEICSHLKAGTAMYLCERERVCIYVCVCARLVSEILMWWPVG